MNQINSSPKKQKVVDRTKLCKREGLWYEADSEKPFTGKSFVCGWHTTQKWVEGEWCEGKASGEWIYWHENGQKKGRGDYCDGKLHGKWTFWHENGQKDQEGSYSDGKRCGKWTYCYENGQKEAELEYHNGKLNGKITYWHKNGKKQVESEYLAGKVHGNTTRWYYSGLKQGEGEFRGDELIDGKCWDENGNPIPCPSISEGTIPPFMADSDFFTAHDFNRWYKTPMHRRSMKYNSQKREFATKKKILAVLYTLKFARTVGEWHETGIIRKHIDLRCFPSASFSSNPNKKYERILKSLLNTNPPLIETDLPIIEDSMPFFPASMTIKRYIKITNAGIKEVESWPTVKRPAAATGRTHPKVHDSKADTKNVFRKSGDYWEIRYQGREIGPLEDLKGFSYIKVLLDDPSNEYHVLDLSRKFEGSGLPTPNDNYKKMTPEELEKEGVTNQSSPFGGLETITPEALHRIGKDLGELREAKKEAEIDNDLGRVETIQEKIEVLEDYLSDAYDINGNLRKTGSAAERARKSVSAAIKRSLNKIKKHDKKFELHLRKSLNPISANFLQYTPEEPLDWITS